MVVLLGAAPPLIARPHGGAIHRPRRGFPARRCREILWSASSAISKTSRIAWSAWKGKQWLVFLLVLVICRCRLFGLDSAVFWYFIPPAATDKRTIENPFLTREDFLVRCLSPQVPPSAPFPASAALGLAVPCLFMTLTHAFSLLSISLPCLPARGFDGSIFVWPLSHSPSLLCPTDRRRQWRRLESRQLPRSWVW